jgi:hypothetical protein
MTRGLLVGALLLLLAIGAIWMIGRAIDQVQAAGCALTAPGQTTGAPCP